MHSKLALQFTELERLGQEECRSPAASDLTHPRKLPSPTGLLLR